MYMHDVDSSSSCSMMSPLKRGMRVDVKKQRNEAVEGVEGMEEIDMPVHGIRDDSSCEQSCIRIKDYLNRMTMTCRVQRGRSPVSGLCLIGDRAWVVRRGGTEGGKSVSWYRYLCFTARKYCLGGQGKTPDGAS